AGCAVEAEDRVSRRWRHTQQRSLRLGARRRLTTWRTHSCVPCRHSCRHQRVPAKVESMKFSALFTLFLSICLAQNTAHFHHVHINTTDPTKAIEFYTTRFDCEKARFAGALDAVWAQKSWLLFNKVTEAPPWELISAIWHIGWGAEDMKAT